MSYGPGEGCAVTADLNRYMDEQDKLELTPRQERLIDAALREKAEDEAIAGDDEFREWLVESSHPNGGGGVALVCAVCNIFRIGDADRDDLIADARRNLIAEYVAYRMDNFTDDERAEVERDVLGDA